jgi:excisionase family DNA binding protein
VNDPLALTLPPEAVEAIARRAGELVLEQLRRNGQRAEAKYLTVDEAAELYRCKPQRIYELVSARKLTSLKEGGRLLLLRSELEQRLERREPLASRRAAH